MKLITTTLTLGLLAVTPASQSLGETPTPAPDGTTATTSMERTTTDRTTMDEATTDRPTAETLMGDRDKDKKYGKIYPLDEVIGSTIYSADDERIGSLQDVVFDENTGEIAAAVIDVSGWLEITSRLTPVSPKLLKPRKDDDEDLTLTATKAEVNAAGHIEGEDFPDDLDQEATGRITKGLGMKNAKFGKLVRATKVTDAKLYDAQGDEIGNVHKLFVNKGDHRVVYGVVSVGDWIDSERGDRLAIPWEMIRQSEKEDRAGFVLNATHDQVSKAPAFKDGDEPDFKDDTWNRDVHTYYGLQWTERRTPGERREAAN